MIKFLSPNLNKCLLLSLIALTGAFTVWGRRVKTRRSGTSPVVAEAEMASAAFDTITLPESASAVTISGYDKPLRATRETVFITNNDTAAIASMVLSIGYFDTKGRMIHKAQQRVEADIPPTETRQVSFPSWDRQHSFYYHRSTPPSRVSAIPYDVRITADTIIVGPR